MRVGFWGLLAAVIVLNLLIIYYVSHVQHQIERRRGEPGRGSRRSPLPVSGPGGGGPGAGVGVIGGGAGGGVGDGESRGPRVTVPLREFEDFAN